MLRYKLIQKFLLAAFTLFFILILGTFSETRGIGAKIPEITLPSPKLRVKKPVTLKIVTFNIQDTPFVSSDRPARMRAIAEKLCSLDPDIVGFQEAFIRKDRQILIENLAKCSRLQHHQYYPSRVAGSGLLILSTFPIEHSSFLQFSDSNPFYKINEGDWWAGKGAALARIELPDDGGYIDVFNTHAQAGYGNPAYEIVRKNQMTELARFVNQSATGKAPALLVGDMNCLIGSVDCTTAINGASLERMMSLDSGVDHIFAVENPEYRFELLGTDRIDDQIDRGGELIPLSDHRGYLSTIRIIPQFKPQPKQSHDD